MVQRRRWTFAEKLRTVEESSLPGDIAPNLVFRWRKPMSEGRPSGELGRAV